MIYLPDVPFSDWTSSYDYYEALVVTSIAESIPVSQDRVDVVSVFQAEDSGSMVEVLIGDFHDADSAEHVNQIEFDLAADLGEAEIEINEPVSGQSSMGGQQQTNLFLVDDVSDPSSDLTIILTLFGILSIILFLFYRSRKKRQQKDAQANDDANLTSGEIESEAIELGNFENNILTPDVTKSEESEVDLEAGSDAAPVSIITVDPNVSMISTKSTASMTPTTVDPVAGVPAAAAESSGRKKVTALRDFKASKPVQMSFAKGDVIEVVNTSRAWHTGVLVTSSAYPITGKTLYYPPNFVRPTEQNSESEHENSEIKNVTPVSPVSTVPEPEHSHVALRSFEATKPQVQMSFEKGDLVKAVKTTGKWHQGVLVKSARHSITGKVLYYPPNYFQAKTNLSSSSNVEQEKPILVVAKAAFTAVKPSQMSFSRGDIIQELDSTAAWHRGVLKRSTTHPCNGKVLHYPPNYVKKLDATPVSNEEKKQNIKRNIKKTTKNVATPVSNEEKKQNIKRNIKKTTKNVKKPTPAPVNDIEVGDIVIAIRDFAPKKAIQLSFAKGDKILVMDTVGKWYRGQLRTSSKYDITGQILFFPPNLVRREQDLKNPKRIQKDE